MLGQVGCCRTGRTMLQSLSSDWKFRAFPVGADILTFRLGYYLPI